LCKRRAMPMYTEATPNTSTFSFVALYAFRGRLVGKTPRRLEATSWGLYLETTLETENGSRENLLRLRSSQVVLTSSVAEKTSITGLLPNFQIAVDVDGPEFTAPKSRTEDLFLPAA
jgi:hypothetical protein